MTRKGQTDLVSTGIGIMVIAVVLAGVAVPVVQNSLVLDTKAVDNETHNATGSFPHTFTVDNVGEGLVKDSETLVFVNATGDGSKTTVQDSNYKVDYATGEFNVTDVTGVSSADSGDYYSVDYTYKPDGYVKSDTARLVLSYIDLMLVLALFVAAMSIVR